MLSHLLQAHGSTCLEHAIPLLSHDVSFELSASLPQQETKSPSRTSIFFSQRKGYYSCCSIEGRREGFSSRGDQSWFRPQPGSSQNISARCIKERRGSVKMVVGDDIHLNDVPQLMGKTLVGIFNGKSMGEKALTGWMINQWKPLIGYAPKVHILSRNWISFIFLSAEDCEEI
jgi:hypothetical protein